MTAQEREMLKMTDEEFKSFQKTQPMVNGKFILKADDYVSWLKRNKNKEVSIATVRNKLKAGSIDGWRHESFYPENNGVTQAITKGKKEPKEKFSVFVIMNMTTMSYDGYNDGSISMQGKPIKSTTEKKERLKQTEKELKARGIEMD